MTSQVAAISVDFYDEQQNNSSTIGVRIRINNDTNVPITNAKIRYYFHRTSASYVIDDYYLAGATLNYFNINSELAYFEISIPSIPVGYYPDMAGFSLALHYDNYSYWDKISDYSYLAAPMLMKNPKIVLLSNDEVLFGEVPNAIYTPAPSKISFSGIKFSNSPWFEMKNIGASAASTSNYTLVGNNNSFFSIGDYSLDVGEILRICKNQVDCDSVAKSIVLSEFDWNDAGEAFLKRDSSMVSYIAWGQPGSSAADAHMMGLWEDSLAYFPIMTEVHELNADYTKNVFFRLMPQKNPTSINNWFCFSSNDNPAITASVPLPIKRSANKPIIKRVPGEHDILFSWVPVNGIDEYRVIVRDQNQDIVYDRKTTKSSLKLPLVQGNYSWIVLGGDEYEQSREYVNPDGGVTLQVYENIYIEDANINTDIYKQLHIHEIAARRDTKMLNLGYLENTYLYSWDRPNLDAIKYELHENSRCWAIAIEIINHFYGGNLTQDEIVYKAKFKDNDPLLSPFYKDGSSLIDQNTKELTGETAIALKWALHTDVLNYSTGAPSYSIVRNAIDNGKLVFISVSEHDMVIYGYVGDENNYAFYYAFIDNDGNIGNSLFYDKPILAYAIPDVIYGNVEMSDARIHMDSDNDGITNFEEEERFHTDPFLIDTDNDGIEDKREIYNYTIRANDKTHLSFNPYRPIIFANGEQYKNPIYEDFDKIYNAVDLNKNNIYAENDPDNDNDGVEDGLKGGEHVVFMDVPDHYTIFGREYVKINDGVKCYDTPRESNSYCNIAAAGEYIFSYNFSFEPINVGARAHVGKIDAQKPILVKTPGEILNPVIRNSALIHGDINIYALPYIYGTSEFKELKNRYGNIEDAKAAYIQSQNISNYITKQHNVTIEGNTNLLFLSDWNKNYTYEFSRNMPQVPKSKNKAVRAGETYHLKDGDVFSTLHVEPQATLIIEPGEMFVEKKLQIDPNATIRFADPGKGTVLHTNGEIIWRSYNSENANNIQYWTNVARGFKLAHHSSQKFYIEGLWAGTIFAPKAKVIMGQVNKTIYGRILARGVVVHQYAKVYRVDFNPTDAMQVAYAQFLQKSFERRLE